MNGKISGNDKPCQVNLEELVVEISSQSFPQELIAPKPLSVVENEQYNGNSLPFHQQVSIENEVEPQEVL